MVRLSASCTGASPSPAQRRHTIAARRLCSDWPGLAVFAAVVVGFAVLIVQALNNGAYAGAAVVGGFLGLCVWQSGTYFWRNRPGRYRPDALPKELVPDGWPCAIAARA
jgi:O-antigen/teichoic acid export membrane protein